MTIVTFRVNGQSTSYSSVPATVLAGGWLGRADNTFFVNSAGQQTGIFSTCGFFVLNKGYTDIVLNEIYKAIVADHEIYPQIRNNIIFDGDSIVEGTNKKKARRRRRKNIPVPSVNLYVKYK